MTDAIYTRSTGAQVRVADMATPHLKSAHAKLAREFPGHSELPGMRAEIDRREAQAAFEHTGTVADHQMEDPFQ